MTTPADQVTIGTLSKRVGVHIETIRYYEKIGLMAKPPRTAGGHRIYDPAHTRRLAFIKRGRELGFALGDVRDLLELVDSEAFSCMQVHDLTLAHLHDVRRKLRDLRKLEKVLSKMAAECLRGDVPECPIIDALFGDVAH